MRIHVVVWRRERHDKAGEHVTEETITFVAPDEKGQTKANRLIRGLCPLGRLPASVK